MIKYDFFKFLSAKNLLNPRHQCSICFLISDHINYYSEKLNSVEL